MGWRVGYPLRDTERHPFDVLGYDFGSLGSEPNALDRALSHESRWRDNLAFGEADRLSLDVGLHG